MRRDRVSTTAFAAFAAEVDNRLWLLGVEPKFAFGHGVARWSCAPYAAELQASDSRRARVLLFAGGKLCHASEPGRTTIPGAHTLAHAIAIMFAGSAVIRRSARVAGACDCASAGTAVARRAHTPPHVTSETSFLPRTRETEVPQIRCRTQGGVPLR